MKYKVFNKETGEEATEVYLTRDGKVYEMIFVEEKIRQVRELDQFEELEPSKYAVCKFTGFYTKDKEEIYENMRILGEELGTTGNVYWNNGQWWIGNLSLSVFINLNHGFLYIKDWQFDGKFFPLSDTTAPSKTDCTKSHQEDKIAPETITINFDSPFSHEDIVIVPPSKKTFGEMMEETYGERLDRLEKQIKGLGNRLDERIKQLVEQDIDHLYERINNLETEDRLLGGMTQAALKRFEKLEKRIKELEDGETTDIERLDQKITELDQKINALELEWEWHMSH